MHEQCKANRKPRFSLSSIEWIIVIATLGILIAVLIPRPRWASSGEIEIPVRIVVFDLEQELPITDAQVRILHLSPMVEGQDIPTGIEKAMNESAAEDKIHRTGNDGTAIIRHTFRTSASDRSSVSTAHTRWEWVLVSAEGYEKVLVPVRYQSNKSPRLATPEEFIVPIGLTRCD